MDSLSSFNSEFSKLESKDKALVLGRLWLRVWPAIISSAFSNWLKLNHWYGNKSGGDLLLRFLRFNFSFFGYSEGISDFYKLRFSGLDLKNTILVLKNFISVSFPPPYPMSYQAIVALEKMCDYDLEFIEVHQENLSSEYLAAFDQVLNSIDSLEFLDARSEYVFEFTDIYESIVIGFSLDIQRLTNYHNNNSKIKTAPLWKNGRRPIKFEMDRHLRQRINPGTSNLWGAWGRWYRARKSGKKTYALDFQIELGLNEATSRELVGYMKVNECINRNLFEFLDDTDENEKSSELEDHKLPTPEIPTNKPSALNITWSGDRLVAKKENAESKLNSEQIDASFQALRELILSIANSLNQENSDRRIIKFLEELSNRIPNSNSTISEIFLFAHKTKVLEELSPIMQQECSNITIAEFHALILASSEALLQFPDWRAFKKNAAEQTLDELDLDEIRKSIGVLNAEFTQGDVSEIIDQSVVIGIEEGIEESMSQNNLDLPIQKDSVGREILQDTLFGIENIIKEFAKKALGAVSAFAGDNVADFRAGMIEEFKDASKNLGKKTGNFLVVTLPLVLGSTLLWPYILQNWTWLKPIIEFLKSVASTLPK